MSKSGRRNSEAKGANGNNTLSFDEATPKGDLIPRPEPKGEDINVGKLMTILSIKNYEAREFRNLKARIVIRGDDNRNADNTICSIYF